MAVYKPAYNFTGFSGTGKVFAIIGDSNCDGAAFTSALPAALTGLMTGVQIWNPFAGSFTGIHAGVNNNIKAHLYSPTGDTHGVELRLGYELWDQLGETVFLVKQGLGSTTQTYRQPVGDDWSTLDLYPWYRDGVLKPAIRSLANYSGTITGKLEAVFIFLGTVDAALSLSSGYYSGLSGITTAFRNDFGNPTLPVIQIGLHTGIAASGAPQFHIDSIIAQQSKWDGDSQDNGLLPGSAYQLSGDFTHYTTTGYEGMGQNMRAMYLNLR